MWERNIHQLPLPWTPNKDWTCNPLTGNWIGDLSLCGTMLNWATQDFLYHLILHGGAGIHKHIDSQKLIIGTGNTKFSPKMQYFYLIFYIFLVSFTKQYLLEMPLSYWSTSGSSFMEVALCPTVWTRYFIWPPTWTLFTVYSCLTPGQCQIMRCQQCWCWSWSHRLFLLWGRFADVLCLWPSWLIFSLSSGDTQATQFLLSLLEGRGNWGQHQLLFRNL